MNNHSSVENEYLTQHNMKEDDGHLANYNTDSNTLNETSKILIWSEYHSMGSYLLQIQYGVCIIYGRFAPKSSQQTPQMASYMVLFYEYKLLSYILPQFL